MTESPPYRAASPVHRCYRGLRLFAPFCSVVLGVRAFVLTFVPHGCKRAAVLGEPISFEAGKGKEKVKLRELGNWSVLNLAQCPSEQKGSSVKKE